MNPPKILYISLVSSPDFLEIQSIAYFNESKNYKLNNNLHFIHIFFTCKQPAC